MNRTKCFNKITVTLHKQVFINECTNMSGHPVPVCLGSDDLRCVDGWVQPSTSSLKVSILTHPADRLSTRQPDKRVLLSFSVKLHMHTQTLIFSSIWWHSERIVEKLRGLLLPFHSCQVSPRQSEHSVQSKLTVCVYQDTSSTPELLIIEWEMCLFGSADHKD